MMGKTTLDAQAPATQLAKREPNQSGATLSSKIVNRREFLFLQLFVYLNLSIGGLIREDLFAWDDCTLWDDKLSWS
jgi:hypothetical protein